MTGVLVAPSASSATSAPRPVRVMFIGDSVGMWLDLAMSSAGWATHYGVVTSWDGTILCGLVADQAVYYRGSRNEALATCRTSPPPGTVTLPETWAAGVTTFKPDVVVIESGRWEVGDVEVAGRTTSIEQPGFRRQVAAALDSAVRISSARGAHVVLMTAPCYNNGLQADHKPWPADSPRRLAIYNGLVRHVASTHRSTVTLVDLHRMLCPGGRYTSTIDGMVVRSPDGIHVLGTAGAFYGPRLWPTIVAAGRRSHVSP